VQRYRTHFRQWQVHGHAWVYAVQDLAFQPALDGIRCDGGVGCSGSIALSSSLRDSGQCAIPFVSRQNAPDAGWLLQGRNRAIPSAIQRLASLHVFHSLLLS
jgi:hypothetical protein